MRSSAELRAVEQLLAKGLNDCEVSRQTSIPRTTVRDWRRHAVSRAGAARASERELHKHDFDRLPPAYAYLLGLYLGDGCISQNRRGVYRLRITLDLRYPGIIAACRDAMAVVLPASRASVQFRRDGQCVEVYSSSKHWPCLLPQHGSGPKHMRLISLTGWQRRICNQYPELLLRGLIHSDGCRVINRVWGGAKRYAYPRYEFSNRSPEIRRIFCDYCDALGIAWTQMKPTDISVARREAVAKLDGFVGPKR